MAAKEFIVAIELGSSKLTGVAGRKNADGSINVLAVVKEDASSFIRRGVVYNIDKTVACLTGIVAKLKATLKTDITQVYVGVGGQSIHSVKNTIVKDLPADTKVTQEMVAELMDLNRSYRYPDQEILDSVTQEYRLDNLVQLDPVGVQCTHLEATFLNILARASFYKSWNECFELAGIHVAEMCLAPIALANSVLTEQERRSGCALVDIGADTTTICVYSKNILRHISVIPLGSHNITKDLTSLQMEEDEAERMKIKYGCAFTEESLIDDTLKLSVDAERQVDSRRFIEAVEGRVLEIIENVQQQIPLDYQAGLLGGIILTGGGSNMPAMEQAFARNIHVDKIRTAKTGTTTITGNQPDIKEKNATMNSVLGLLARGDMNCAGGDLTQGNLFDKPAETVRPVAKPANAEAATGRVLTPAEKKAAEEAMQRKRDQEEAERLRKEQEEAERIRREKAENSPVSKFFGMFKKGVGKLIAEE